MSVKLTERVPQANGMIHWNPAVIPMSPENVELGFNLSISEPITFNIIQHIPYWSNTAKNSVVQTCVIITMSYLIYPNIFSPENCSMILVTVNHWRRSDLLHLFNKQRASNVQESRRNKELICKANATKPFWRVGCATPLA